jgi:hypothetical protein
MEEKVKQQITCKQYFSCASAMSKCIFKKIINSQQQLLWRV